MNPRSAFENTPSKGERSERVVVVWRRSGVSESGGRWVVDYSEPLSTFLRHNADRPVFCAAICRLAPGDSFIDGGGAAPLFKVEVW